MNAAFNDQPQISSGISVHKIHTDKKDGMITFTFDMTGNGSSVSGTKKQDPRCAKQILKEKNQTATQLYTWCASVGRCTKSHCPKGVSAVRAVAHAARVNDS